MMWKTLEVTGALDVVAHCSLSLAGVISSIQTAGENFGFLVL